MGDHLCIGSKATGCDNDCFGADALFISFFVAHDYCVNAPVLHFNIRYRGIQHYLYPAVINIFQQTANQKTADCGTIIGTMSAVYTHTACGSQVI